MTEENMIDGFIYNKQCRCYYNSDKTVMIQRIRKGWLATNISTGAIIQTKSLRDARVLVRICW